MLWGVWFVLINKAWSGDARPSRRRSLIHLDWGVIWLSMHYSSRFSFDARLPEVRSVRVRKSRIDRSTKWGNKLIDHVPYLPRFLGPVDYFNAAESLGGMSPHPR
ncbi:hypothetical protein P691DRAFT_429324 [Macrolepiota fuliginosa MF-IS2]|uniref:Uncharacterized protein n=1 Tax=Macrolepiota fuliginosa MF-IS2 TaxID=1400762 RepID=A0A9P6C6H5_9AGAR|nr:hypothetical protein P691DRAFT_429324 [Macrolepiota fuliginosa MF-IS2]